MSKNSLKIATFKADITPPLGSPLCGGLVAPAVAVGSPLSALGVILTDASGPVVLCALDWCELRGSAHRQWCTAIASAAGTTPDRVAVQCVHQHDAPLVDKEADAMMRREGLPPTIDGDWHDKVLADTAAGVKAAMGRLRPLTHITYGSAGVDRVASNRRVMGEDGRVRAVRYSACTDAAMREAPEGLIDPMLRSLGLWDGNDKIAALHYYATHPMSQYGKGIISHDFAGDARERLSAADGALHIYFNGCAGDITAGKYNDGSDQARQELTARLLEGMRQSEMNSQRIEAESMAWHTHEIFLTPGEKWRDIDALKARIADAQLRYSARHNHALAAVFAENASKYPIVLSCLTLADRIKVLHLPGEPFVEYQLWAQQRNSRQWVAVAGYGDGAPGYIPLERSFAEGGYEQTWAFAEPETEGRLKRALDTLL